MACFLVPTAEALIVTVKWYTRKDDTMQLGILCFLFWGASLMWLVDAVFEYAELGAEYFIPAPADMLNDAFLGFSVIALALVIWLVRLLITDPKGVIRTTLLQKRA